MCQELHPCTFTLVGVDPVPMCSWVSDYQSDYESDYEWSRPYTWSQPGGSYQESVLGSAGLVLGCHSLEKPWSCAKTGYPVESPPLDEIR